MDNRPKRRAQSIQDMLDNPTAASTRRSGYTGPKTEYRSSSVSDRSTGAWSTSDISSRISTTGGSISRSAGADFRGDGSFNRLNGNAPAGGSARTSGGYSGPRNPNASGGYSGPRNPNASGGYNGPRTASASGGYKKNPSGAGRLPKELAGILDYAWIVYMVLLFACVMTAVLYYNSHHKVVNGYSFPNDMITSSGVINNIFDDYFVGGALGSGAGFAKHLPGNTAAASEPSDSVPSDSQDSTSAITDENGNPITSSAPNTTTGAAMALDTGGDYGNYTAAASHSEVLTQLQGAIASGDIGFVGRKLAYKDETTGNLYGYPQSIVEHFTEYMQNNPDKLTAFIAAVGPENYAGENEGAHIIVLPLIRFTVNMGFNNTTLSISGFSDRLLNAGDSATLCPLLPCMYTIKVSNDAGIQTSEIEANLKEGNLKINIGTKQ